MSIRSSLLISALAVSAFALGTGVTALRAADQVVISGGVTIQEEAPPTFVEEGATFNGAVVVVPAEPVDYVFINNGWYYYHPGLKTWVHVNHEKDWRPPNNGHVFNKWSDHPMYHRGK